MQECTLSTSIWPFNDISPWLLCLIICFNLIWNSVTGKLTPVRKYKGDESPIEFVKVSCLKWVPNNSVSLFPHFTCIPKLISRQKHEMVWIGHVQAFTRSVFFPIIQNIMLSQYVGINCVWILIKPLLWLSLWAFVKVYHCNESGLWRIVLIVSNIFVSYFFFTTGSTLQCVLRTSHSSYGTWRLWHCWGRCLNASLPSLPW